MSFKQVGELAAEELETPNFKVVGSLEEVDILDVLAGAGPRALLQARTVMGGGMKIFGDLLRIDTLADVGADIAKASAQEAADSIPLGATPLQMGISSGLESGMMMAGPAAFGGFKTMMGAALATTAGPRYAELRDKGFSGGMAGFHTSLDVLAEYVGERSGLKALSDIGMPVLRRVSEFVARDMVGEQVTNFYQQLNALMSDNPDMTIGQFLDSAKMTAIATPFAAGAQVGGAMTGAAARGEFRAPPPAAPGPAGEVLPPAGAPPQNEPPILPQPPAEPPAPSAPPIQEPTPPGESPAPTADKPYDWGGWFKAQEPDGPEIYMHNVGTEIRQDIGGWSIFSNVTSDPIAYGFKTPQEAHRFAQRYEWDTDLSNATWDWTDRKDALINKEYPEFLIVKGKGKLWQLLDPNGNRLTDFSGKLGDFLPRANKQILDQQLGKVVKPKKTPPPDEGFLSMFEATPEEMLAQKKIDPRVYNGVLAGGMGKVHVWRADNGQWFVDFTEGMFGGAQPKKLGNTRDAIFQLEDMTLTRLSTIAQLKPLYDQAVMEGMLAGEQGHELLSDNVDAYFGGRLAETKTLGRAKRDNLKGIAQILTLSEPRNVVRQTDFPLSGYNLPKSVVPLGGGIEESGEDVARHRTPGIYVDNYTETGDRAVGLSRVAGAVEKLRTVFAPNTTIIFRAGKPIGMGGSTSVVRNGTYLITLDGWNFTDAKKLGRLLQVAFHEFGHVVIYEHLTRAAPEVKAKIMNSWLQYTKDVTADGALGAYMLEFHNDARLLTPKVQKTQDAEFTAYAMSMSEYLADQAATYFLERESSGFDKMLQQFYEGFIALLQRMFEMYPTVAGITHKDATFYEFLDELAGHDTKAGPARPNAPKGLPPTPNQINAKPPTQQTIHGRAHAEALIKKQMKMWELLVQAGATKEELDALNPTNNVKDFRWQDAYALLDKYGVPRRHYMDSYFVGSVDDTLHFREQLFSLNQQIGSEELRHWIGQSSSDVKAFNWILQKTMTAVQLRKRYGQQVPGVKAFVDTLEAMFAYRSRWKEQADNRLQEMKKMSKSNRLKLFELLLDEDKTGEYHSIITVDATGRRIYTLKDEAVKKFGLGQLEVEAYSKIRSDFTNVLEEMEEVSVAEMERLYGAGTPALFKAVSELKAGFAEMKAKPYVPHTRFGEYSVTVKNAKGQLEAFYQFETEGDAIKLEKELRGSTGAGTVVSRGRLTEQQRIMMGLPPQLINAMKGHLKLSPEQIAEFEDILKNMSNGASFVRKFKRRKNIAGWEDDAENFPRAYADYMSRAANHLSRIKYNFRLTEAKGLVRKQAGEVALEGQNTVEMDELGNWLGRLQDYVNDPQQEFTAARAAATLWYLGLNVKSALVNATSVPFVTVPYLSSRYGEVRSMAGVARAYKDIANQFIRKQALTDDEQKMLAKLREMGILDQSFATELAGIREGGRLTDQMALSHKASIGYYFRHLGMLPFQKVEVVNRQVTALAAYRLARTSKSFAEADLEGYDHAAMEFAKSSVQDTQNENAQWNRAEFMRGRKSILTLFMSYQQNILYQMMGGDPAWMRLLATQMLIAGLMGLPFAQDASDLIKWFASKVLGKDFSPERAIREYVVDFAGPRSDWIMKGLAFDMAGVNLQGSLSQGRVIPGVEALAQEGRFADRFANAAGDVGGAGFSLIMNAMKAISSDDPQLMKRFGVMLPEFIKSGIEGQKMLTEGIATDRAGIKLADVGKEHALARTLGFQVTDVSQARAKRFAQKDVAAHWLARRQAVFNVFELAVDSRDPEWMDKAKTALKEFNDEAPDYGLKISGKQLKASLKSRQRSDQRNEAGLGPSRTVQQTYSRVGELYPD